MFPITGASCCMLEGCQHSCRPAAQDGYSTASSLSLLGAHWPSRQTLEDPRPVTLELPHPHIWVNYRLCLPKTPKR